jgi:hypothetical protein
MLVTIDAKPQKSRALPILSCISSQAGLNRLGWSCLQRSERVVAMMHGDEKKGRSDKYRSRLSAAIHQTAVGLRRIGLVDEATMHEFDSTCLIVGASDDEGNRNP